MKGKLAFLAIITLRVLGNPPFDQLDENQGSKLIYDFETGGEEFGQSL